MTEPTEADVRAAREWLQEYRSAAFVHEADVAPLTAIIARARAEGRAERGRSVVRWLRSAAPAFPAASERWTLAERIERGDDEREG